MIKKTTLICFTFLCAIFNGWTQGPGNALHFDGLNDQVQAPVPTFLNDLTTTDFTFETWVKPEVAIFSRLIFAQPSTTNFATLTLSSTNAVYFYVIENGTTFSGVTFNTLPLGVWSHVAATWNTAANQIEIYINGVVQATSAGGGSSNGTSGIFTLGTRPGGAQFFTGSLDEVRIWSEARTACEIATNYESTLIGTESNLIVYYDFNQGIASGSNTTTTTLPDVSGIEDGTLLNFSLTGPTSNWVSSGAIITSTGLQTNFTTNITAAICQGSTYSFGNQTLSATGDYTNLLTTSQGCDSVIQLHLDVVPVFYNQINISNCNNYFWQQTGQTYTTSGQYNDTLMNQLGCDSIITLNLTIQSSTAASISAIACDTFLLNGQTFTTSGVYIQNITNVAGCDSTLTLNLTINNATTSSVTASACDSYTLNGQTYTASGVYTQSLTNVAGCDSLVTLNLTINTPPTVTATDNGDLTISAASANAYQWINCATGATIVGETAQTLTVSQNGEYAVIGTSADGCSDTSNCVVIDYVGVSENNADVINIYPNPTKDNITVTFSATTAITTVYDSQGKLIQTSELTSGEQITLSTYESGVYFVQFTTEFGTLLKRVVKN